MPHSAPLLIKHTAPHALSVYPDANFLAHNAASVSGSLQPLSALTFEQDAIVLPEDAWSQDMLLGCLAEIAASASIFEDPPTPPDTSDGTLSSSRDCLAALTQPKWSALCVPVLSFAG